MIHYMRLNKQPFEMIASRQKTIELRLNDEKRQKIQPGDIIYFSLIDDPDRMIKTEVIDLYPFNSFKELYASLPLLQCGYTVDNVNDASSEDMYRYYSLEQEQRYGALGIEIHIVD